MESRRHPTPKSGDSENVRLQSAMAPSRVQTVALQSCVSKREAWIIGLMAAAIYAILATVRLGYLGIYYDEVNQAPPAFAWNHKLPAFFIAYSYRGVPILYMPYSGAIKSAVYGLFLRFTHSQFGIVSWRLLAISFVAVGLAGFCILSRHAFSRLGLLVCTSLIVTDTSAILASRHDYGPVALALMLRLLMIAFFLRAEFGSPTAWLTFALGLSVGISIFEKLNNVVLIPALAILLLTGVRIRSPKLLAITCAGICVGLGPLIFANIQVYRSSHYLISFVGLHPDPIIIRSTGPRIPAMRQLWETLALGQGAPFRRLILGTIHPSVVSAGEAVLTAALLASALLLPVLSRVRSFTFSAAARMAVCYFVVYAGLAAMPRTTGPHHWMTGAPFNFVAIGLVCGAVDPVAFRSKYAAVIRQSLIVGISALFVLRIYGIVTLEQSLLAGRASSWWDPSINRYAEFAAKTSNAEFISTNWGTAIQPYCLSNGRRDIFLEPFWSYGGVHDLQRIADRNGIFVFYLVSLLPSPPVVPETEAAILRDANNLVGWREASPEPEIRSLRSVSVRKFVRIGFNNRL